MRLDKASRRAINQLSVADRRLLQAFEAVGTVSSATIPQLCSALSQPELRLIGFSCVDGDDDGEKKIAIGDFGFFHRRARGQIKKLLELIQDYGKVYQFQILIDDLEFGRAWGWTRLQAELIEACQSQINQLVRENIYPLADISLWSELEPEALALGCPTYESMLQWAELPAQSLLVHQDIEQRRTFRRHRHKRPAELRPTSLRRVAAYALQGRALEPLFPQAVLLQAELLEVGQLYQARRQVPLPIVHC